MSSGTDRQEKRIIFVFYTHTPLNFIGSTSKICQLSFYSYPLPEKGLHFICFLGFQGKSWDSENFPPKRFCSLNKLLISLVMGDHQRARCSVSGYHLIKGKIKKVIKPRKRKEILVRSRQAETEAQTHKSSTLLIRYN